MATIMSVNVCDSSTTLTPPAYEIPPVLSRRLSMMLLRRVAAPWRFPAVCTRVSYPFIEMKHRVEIFGHGQATRIVAFTDKGIPSTKNGSYECTGVFHTGSYTTPMSGGTNQNKAYAYGRA